MPINCDAELERMRNWLIFVCFLLLDDQISIIWSANSDLESEWLSKWDCSNSIHDKFWISSVVKGIIWEMEGNEH